MTPEQPGLLQSAQRAPQPGQQPDLQEEEATPEEQEAYERVVTAGLKIFADKRANGRIIATLERAGYKEASIAQVVVEIVTTIDQRMDGAIPETVVIPAAEELLDVVLDYLIRLRKIDQGRINVEAIAQAMAQQLMQFYGTTEEELAQVTGQAPGGGNGAT